MYISVKSKRMYVFRLWKWIQKNKSFFIKSIKDFEMVLNAAINEFISYLKKIHLVLFSNSNYHWDFNRKQVQFIFSGKYIDIMNNCSYNSKLICPYVCSNWCINRNSLRLVGFSPVTRVFRWTPTPLDIFKFQM